MSKAMAITVQKSAGRSALALIVWLALSFGAAAIGGFFMPGEWYAALKKPSWNPPGWIFGLHWTGVAFAEIVLLWLAIAATIAAFRQVRRVAAWLLAPYLAWVSFASVLNFALWRLNS